MDLKNIIHKNKQNIKNIIRIFTKEENEDLEQEVYLKIWKNSKKCATVENLKSWIGVIAKNTSLDYLKSKKYKCEKLLYDDDYIFENQKDKKPNPELKLIQNERQKRIFNEIERLKPKLKEVILLVEIEGKSYQECAEKLNCPIGTIKSRIYTAKKELAEKLSDLL